MMTQSLGRVHIIEGTPPSLPGKCSMCGTTEGSFIDFGFELDFYGVVYFCVKNCFQEIANAFDYHSPRQWKMMMNAYNDLRSGFNDLRDENERLKNALDSLSNLNISDTPQYVDDLVIESDPEPETKSESSESNGGNDPGIEESEQRSPQSNNEQRLSHVQRDDSLDQFLESI